MIADIMVATAIGILVVGCLTVFYLHRALHAALDVIEKQEQRLSEVERILCYIRGGVTWTELPLFTDYPSKTREDLSRYDS